MEFFFFWEGGIFILVGFFLKFVVCGLVYFEFLELCYRFIYLVLMLIYGVFCWVILCFIFFINKKGLIMFVLGVRFKWENICESDLKIVKYFSVKCGGFVVSFMG